MVGDDDNDAVYASILARVEQSELHNQLCNRSQLQRVAWHDAQSAQLQAAGGGEEEERKRPLDKKEIRASSLEEEEKEVAVNGSLQSDGDGEDGNELDILERDKVNVQEQEEESDVECLRVVAPVERRTRAVELRVEKPIQEQHQEDDDSDVEIIEVVLTRGGWEQRKHLTVTELDGYLFAHKRITDEEADEVGRAIETIHLRGHDITTKTKDQAGAFWLTCAR
ncbi:hypothetical protein GQ600_6482 [Phytophthora cactorum]|nr:hypothetical protein GQ600_6482 [Phytophthora cactorum]